MNGVQLSGSLAALLLIAFIGGATAAQPGIACVQNQLNALGFEAGPADGSIGKKTRAAAEEYRAWMSGGAGNPGWDEPPLTALNGTSWCEKVAEDHPEVEAFAAAERPIAQSVSVRNGEIVGTFSLPAEGKITDVFLYFKFTTECEGDHWANFTGPNGVNVIVMNRGNNRCNGRPTVYTSDNKELGQFFAGSSARGDWKFEFKDLDSNFEQGSLELVRVTWTVENNGVSTIHTATLNGLPLFAPNPS